MVKNKMKTLMRCEPTMYPPFQRVVKRSTHAKRSVVWIVVMLARMEHRIKGQYKCVSRDVLRLPPFAEPRSSLLFALAYYEVKKNWFATKTSTAATDAPTKTPVGAATRASVARPASLGTKNIS